PSSSARAAPESRRCSACSTASSRPAAARSRSAAGRPRPLKFSVTKGVVSGLRTYDALDYIQSDVKILPGSSGGPLLDAHGNAVGVASAGIGIQQVPVGVNFFVPLADLDKYLPVELK